MSKEDAKPPRTWTFKADDDIGLDRLKEIQQIVESIQRNASTELQAKPIIVYLQSIKSEDDVTSNYNIFSSYFKRPISTFQLAEMLSSLSDFIDDHVIHDSKTEITVINVPKVLTWDRLLQAVQSGEPSSNESAHAIFKIFLDQEMREAFSQSAENIEFARKFFRSVERLFMHFRLKADQKSPDGFHEVLKRFSFPCLPIQPPSDATFQTTSSYSFLKVSHRYLAQSEIRFEKFELEQIMKSSNGFVRKCMDDNEFQKDFEWIIRGIISTWMKLLEQCIEADHDKQKKRKEDKQKKGKETMKDLCIQ